MRYLRVTFAVVVALTRVPSDAVPTGQQAPLDASDSILPVPHPQCVRDDGPLDDEGVPEEQNSFLRTLPEVLQCVYVMKVPVYLQCGTV